MRIEYIVIYSDVNSVPLADVAVWRHLANGLRISQPRGANGYCTSELVPLSEQKWSSSTFSSSKSCDSSRRVVSRRVARLESHLTSHALELQHCQLFCSVLLYSRWEWIWGKTKKWKMNERRFKAPVKPAQPQQACQINEYLISNSGSCSLKPWINSVSISSQQRGYYANLTTQFITTTSRG